MTAGRTSTARRITGTAGTWLRRVDRHTLDVVNPGLPYRPRVDRS